MITILIYSFLTLINVLILRMHFFEKYNKNTIKKKATDLESRAFKRPKQESEENHQSSRILKEIEMPHLKEINKKRTFKVRLPLTEDIKCNPHFKGIELAAFLSFLTENTTYFETGSGCSSIIAKYFAKKSYAVEGCKEWYNEGVKQGLKNNLIFKDLKPDNPIWSYPGKKSNINDWKNYFQSYDKSYNADVILIDGRFKVATAMDLFNKINDNTIILIHEYQSRPQYFILENYYQYVYHWGRLVAFVKKKDIDSIPLKVQKKYWDKFL